MIALMRDYSDAASSENGSRLTKDQSKEMTLVEIDTIKTESEMC